MRVCGSNVGWRCVSAGCVVGALLLASGAKGWDEVPAKDAEPAVTLGDPVRLPQKGDLRGPELADLDRDGKLDLVCGNYGGQFLFCRRSDSEEIGFYPETPLGTADGEVQLKHW